MPSASHRLAELAIEAGVPAGVLNLIHGGKETVDQLLERDEIKAVSFVGSTPVGTAIYRKATSRGEWQTRISPFVSAWTLNASFTCGSCGLASTL